MQFTAKNKEFILFERLRIYYLFIYLLTNRTNLASNVVQIEYKIKNNNQ